MQTVYIIEYDASIERPEIDFTAWVNQSNNWTLLNDILDQKLPSSAWIAAGLVVESSDVGSWDIYCLPGTLGMFSARAIESLGSNAWQYFELLPCKINEYSYWIPKCVRPISCLDVEESDIVYFSHAPHRVKDVRHYVFCDGMLPESSIFCVPEMRNHLLCTDIIREMVLRRRLHGIRLRTVP